MRANRSKKQGAYGKVPVIKAGKLAQLSHLDEVIPRSIVVVGGDFKLNFV